MTGSSTPDASGGSSTGVDGQPVVVEAPAKVNLSLLVGPPQEDGYHPLSTVFVPLDLVDRLEIRLEARAHGTPERSHAFEVVCPGVAHNENLVTRALRSLEARTGFTFSGRLVVHKQIPKGAGLGGGSSDAATALRAAAELIGRSGGPSLPLRDLQHTARELGADVPFFLDPRPALAAGVGDVLEPLSLPALPLVLLLPGGELSTAEVYRTFDGVGTREPLVAFGERRRHSEQAWKALATAWSARGLDQQTLGSEVARLMTNDLEPASLHLLPELATSRAELDGEDVLGTLMSGSGPTLFAVCASVAKADGVARRLRARGLSARAVMTVGGHRA